MRLFSIGDVVTVALRIYIARFKLYFRLALFAHLWLIIPFYGWAKFFAIGGLISRLAFSELIEQPETPKSSRYVINRRLNKFLLINLLAFIILTLITIIWFVLTLIVLYYFSINATKLLNYLSAMNFNILNFVAAIAMLLILLGIALLFVMGVLLAYSRFFVLNLVLAREDDIRYAQVIGRSWDLTKGFAFRIQWILTIAVLLCLPLEIMVAIAIEIVDWLLYANNPNYWSLESVIIAGLLLLNSAFVMPFLQTIKAVFYYDVCNRKEGLALQLRDI